MLKNILVILTLSMALPAMAEDKLDWAAGVSYGFTEFPDDYDSDNRGKFGLNGNRKLTHWLSVEGGLVRYKNKSTDHCDINNQNCVIWTQKLQFAHVRLRADLNIGRVFAFTSKLAVMQGEHESQFDSRSFTSFYPSVGLKWNIGKKVALIYEYEQSRIPIGNSEKDTLKSLNLTLQYKF